MLQVYRRGYDLFRSIMAHQWKGKRTGVFLYILDYRDLAGYSLSYRSHTVSTLLRTFFLINKKPGCLARLKSCFRTSRSHCDRCCSLTAMHYLKILPFTHSFKEKGTSYLHICTNTYRIITERMLNIPGIKIPFSLYSYKCVD